MLNWTWLRNRNMWIVCLFPSKVVYNYKVSKYSPIRDRWIPYQEKPIVWNHIKYPPNTHYKFMSKDFVSCDVCSKLTSPGYSSMTSIMYNFLNFIHVEIISNYLFIYLLNCCCPSLSLPFSFLKLFSFSHNVGIYFFPYLRDVPSSSCVMVFINGVYKCKENGNYFI